jgi:amino acid adenylation domain-containing protein
MAADIPFSQIRFNQLYISWDCSGAAQKRKRAQNSFLAKVGAKVQRSLAVAPNSHHNLQHLTLIYCQNFRRIRDFGSYLILTDDLAAWKSRCSALLHGLEANTAVPDHYATFGAHALPYGPAFRGISAIRTGDQCGECSVAWQAGLIKREILHPVVADAALQLMLSVLMPDLVDSAVLLPISMQRITVIPGEHRQVTSLSVRVYSKNDAISKGNMVFGCEDGFVASLEGAVVKFSDERVISVALRGASNSSSKESGVRRADCAFSRQWIELPPIVPRAGGGMQGVVCILSFDAVESELQGAFLDVGWTSLAVPVCSAGTIRDELQWEQIGEKMFRLPVNVVDWAHVRRVLESSVWASAGVCTDILVILPGCSGAVDAIEVQDRCVGVADALLTLLQAAASTGAAPRVCFVTRGVGLGVQGSGSAQNVVASVTNGIAQAVRTELPKLRARVLDFDEAETLSVVASCIAAELRHASDELDVCYRRGVRHGVRLERAASLVSAADRNARALPATGFWRLDVARLGVLDSLSFVGCSSSDLFSPAPADHDVVLEVMASGVNFKDVLVALAYVPQDGPLGLECCGRVIAAGRSVTRVAVGDVVFGLAIGTFQSHAVTHEQLVVVKPANLSLTEAAAVPVVFATALFGLETLAHIKAGEHVLVHAAAGGVGLAAVQVCLRAGAIVIGTAGSDAKRSLLRSLGVQHVLDSRSLAFAEQCKAITSGRGVDVVLNSLTGQFAVESLGATAQGGRFVEIGKAGIMTVDEVHALRPDVRYDIVYLVDQMRSQPALVEPLLRAIADGFSDGSLRPIRTLPLPMSNLLTAFRVMQRGQHVGKLVAFVPPASVEARPMLYPHATTALVTGGFGALGLVFARFLVAAGVGVVVLVSRGAPSDAVRAELSGLEREFGAQILCRRADVSIRAEVAALVREIESSHPPLRVVMHCAGLLDDGTIMSQTRAKVERVFAPKVAGTVNLHLETAHVATLAHFVLFSSIVSVLGAAGQANYAAGNAFLDAFSHMRSSIGLPSTSINWGAWGEVGMAADRGTVERFARRGIRALSTADATSTLQGVLASLQAPPQMGIYAVDWPLIIKHAQRAWSMTSVPPYFAQMESRGTAAPAPAPTAAAAATIPTTGRITRSVRARRGQPMSVAAPTQASDQSAAVVEGVLRQVLGLAADVTINAAQPFTEMGLDSLMAVELRNGLAAQFGVAISPTVAFDYPSVRVLAAHMASLTHPPSAGSVAEAPSLRDVSDMVAVHVRAILGMQAGDSIDVNRPLTELGIDSLMAVELRNALSEATRQVLPATLAFDYPSIAALATFIAGRPSADSSPEQAAARSADRPTVPPASASSLSDVTATIVAVLRSILGIDASSPIDEMQPFTEMGLDSLMSVELRTALATEFDRPISATVAFDFPTVRQLASYLGAAEATDGAGTGAPIALATTAAPTFVDAAASERAGDLDDGVAVIGMACRFPAGVESPALFWRALLDGRNLVDESKFRWVAPDDTPSTMLHAALVNDIDQFDAPFFGIAAREADSMDPQHRFILETAWEAIEHAGISPASLSGTRTGVFIGMASHDYFDLANANDLHHHSTYFATGNHHSCGAGRLSYSLGLQGPCLAIDTACSSALVAVHTAARSIINGEADLALVGGVNVICAPTVSTASLNRLNMLSPDGKCHTFDASANGYVRGEGMGMLLLKPLKAAERDGNRVFAVIRGSAVNQDGRSSGLTAPNGPAQERVIQEALLRAKLTPDAVDFVETHGTGTKLGDPIEVTALRNVFGRSGRRSAPLVLGAAKTNTGHLEAGAGAVGLIKLVLSLYHGAIPRNLNFARVNEHLPPLTDIPAVLPSSTLPWPRNAERLRVGSVSSFGFSGTNAHVVVSEAPFRVDARAAPHWPGVILPISGRSRDAVSDLAVAYEHFLCQAAVDSSADPRVAALQLADIAFTAALGRNHFAERIAVAADDVGALARAVMARLPPSDRRVDDVAFAFSSCSGDVFKLACAVDELCEFDASMHDFVVECDAAFCEALTVPTASITRAIEACARRQRFDERLCVAVEFVCAFVLFDLWQRLGLRTAALAADGIGWLVAATVSGALAFDEAVALAAALESDVASCCALVFGAPSALDQLAAARSTRVGVSRLADSLIIFGECDASCDAGLPRGVTGSELEAAGCSFRALSWRRLRAIAGKDAAVLFARCDWRRPDCEIVGLAPSSGAADWLARVCGPSQRPLGAVVDVCERQQQVKMHAWVAIGGDAAALGTRATSLLWLPGVGDPRTAWLGMRRSICALYESGVDVDWQLVRQVQGFVHRPVDVPTYRFQRRRHWLGSIGFPWSDYRSSNSQPIVDVSAARRRLIVDAVAQLLGVEAAKIDPDASLLQSGLDSLTAMEISANLAGEFNVGLSPALALQRPSVNGMLAAIEEALAVESTSSSSSAPAAAPKQSRALDPVLVAVRKRVCEVLNLADVDDDAPLVPLGLDSLLAMELSANLSGDLSLDLSPSFALQQATVRDMVAAVETVRAASSVAAAPAPAAAEGMRFLSSNQMSIWLACQLDPSSAVYNMSAAALLRDGVSLDLLRDAIAQAYVDMPILGDNARVDVDAEAPVLVRVFATPVLDVTACGAVSMSLLLAEMQAWLAVPLRLESDRLVQFRLFQSTSAAVLMVRAHHILLDAKSLALLMNRISDRYSKRPVPQLAAYAAFVGAQAAARAKKLAAAVPYWRSLLSDSPMQVDLFAVNAIRRPFAVRRLLRGDAVRHIEGWARSRAATLSQLFLAAFGRVAAAFLQLRRVVIGVNAEEALLYLRQPVVGHTATVLPVVCGGARSFDEELVAVRRCLAGALEHAVSYDDIAKAASRRPQLPSLLFNFSNEVMAASDLFSEEVCLDLQAGLTHMFFNVLQTSTGMRLTITGADGRHEALAARALDDVIRTVSSDDSAAVCHSECLEWNDTKHDERFVRVDELCGEWCQTQPDSIAVTSGDDHVSFGELDRRADALANALHAMGVRSECAVALCLHRGAELTVAILALMRIGAAYVPIDPSYPLARATVMIDGSCAVLSIGEASVSAESAVAAVDLRRDWTALRAVVGSGARSRVGGIESTMYIIFTSGSTGRPKGVAVSHRSCVNRLRWQADYLGTTSSDRVLQKTSYCFDVSVWELCAPLACGATLVMAPLGAERDPSALQACIDREQVSLLHFVPSMLSVFVMHATSAMDSIRHVVCSGEALPGELSDRFKQSAAGAAELVNLYGPTEAAIDVTAWRCPEQSHGNVPIGRAIWNTQLYVCSTISSGELAPLGANGELLLGGIGLARGYVGRPGLTAERFVPDAFGGGVGGSRLYRTGDICRFGAAGVVEYVGRTDHQVKVRGFRVELGEIEAAVRTASADVRDCVVVVHKSSDESGARLVAYAVVAAPSGVDWRSHADATLGAVRSRLSTELPAHMVPALFVPLAQMPVTTNGKVDRAALPAPDGAVMTTIRASEFVAPRTDAERELAAIWRDLLGVEDVGVNDDFFALGGDSLLAMRMSTRARGALGCVLPLADVFRTPTLSALAALGSRLTASVTAVAIAPVARRRSADDRVRQLSFAQRRLWFIDQFAPGRSTYNMPLAMEVDGLLNVAALGLTLRALQTRHEVLRTVVVSVAGVAQGRVLAGIELDDAFGVAVDDVPDCADSEWRMQDLVQRESSAPFDLERGPLLRLRVVQCVPQRRSLLAVTMHHSVGDGWSIDVLARELAALYAHFVGGGSDQLPLPPLPLQYCDYAEWEAERWSATSFVAEQVAFWRAELSDGHVPALQLPLDFPRPALHTTSSVAAGVVVGAGVAERARVLAQSQGLSMFMVLDAAFQLLLWRYSNQCDFAIGAPVAGRELAEFEPLIGCFVNTIVIRSAVCGGREAVSEFLARTRTRCIDALMHQATPFDRLVDELKIERDVSRSPLFQAMLVLQNAGGASVASERLKLGSLNARALPAASAPAAKFELTLSLAERGVRDGVEGTLVANSDLLNAATTCRLARAFETTVEALVSGTVASVSEVDVTPAEELHASAVEWNDTETPPSSAAAQDVAERVALHANEQPDCVAVIAGDDHVSYAELDRRGSAIASHLRAVGVRSGAFVALRLPRSAEMMVAIVGTLRAGAAYVPIDPLYPVARQEFMLRDSGACVVVACDSTATDQLPVVRLDADWGHGLRSGALEPPPASQLGPVYVIYTSGSTGTPKGVVVTRNSVADRAAWQCARFCVTREARLLSSVSFGFDGSVFEYLPALWAGCCLVLLADAASADPLLRLQCLETHVIDAFAVVVPSIMPAWIDECSLRSPTTVCNALRTIVSGGERLPMQTLHRLQAVFASRAVELENSYGPSEATIFATAEAIVVGSDYASADGASVPIGRAIWNTQLYVCSTISSGELAPLGANGELLLGGIGLARGYVGRPGLTAERFVPDAFGGGVGGSRLYRTGDICRFGAAGVVEYVGRTDHQVKVRGFRVELGEIEAAVRTASADVRDCVVVVHKSSDESGARLVAYAVVAAPSGVDWRSHADATLGAVRSRLSTELPAHMVPALFVPLAQMPVTTNGKVDRAALPAPDGAVMTTIRASEFVAPRTDAERELAAIWRDLLGVEDVGVNDDFFALGGDSLLAMRMSTRARGALGCVLPLADVFRTPTLSALAALGSRLTASVTAVAIAPVARRRSADDRVRQLSFAQRRLWFIDQFAPGRSTYNMPLAMEVDGLLNVAALGLTLRALQTRHEVLRTVVVSVAGVAQGRVLAGIELDDAFGVAVDDVPDCADSEWRMQDLVQRESSAPFDLERGPLLRLRVVQCVPQRRSLLAVTMHHSVGDGWSIDVLARELAALYAHFVGGGSDQLPLPPLPLQYCDYAEWEAERWSATSFVAEQVAFWRAELSDGHVPALQLPLDFPRPALHTTSSVAAGVVVGAGVAERARVLAQSQGLSMFMVLDAAFQLLLWRYSNQCDFAIGAPVAGRELAEFEPLIGCFVNTIVIRSAVCGGREAVSEFLARTRTRCIDALMHQATPFDRLVDELKIERDVSRSPLFQAMLVLQNAGGASVASERLKLGSLNARALPAASAPAAKFELTLSLAERGVRDGVEGTLVANSDLLNAATTCRLARAFETTVEALVSGTVASVSEVDVTPAEELHASAVEWNDTETPPSSAAAQDVAERVALHANEQPDCVAVMASDDHVSYAELDRRGSAIASHLRAVGVRSGAFVALRLPRSAEMMVAIVGTLRAGAAYVPIDPLYPVARQEFMLRDSGACVVVACDSTATDQLPVVRLDADWGHGLRSGALEPPPASQLGPVYVIYTSGSTGTPKGVLVGTAGVCRRAHDMIRRFDVDCTSRGILAMSVSFDGSVNEWLPIMLAGGTLCIVADGVNDVEKRVAHLASMCPSPYVTYVPSMLEQMLRAGARFDSVAGVVCAGERLPKELARAFDLQTARLVNMYGPTEASIFATSHMVERSEALSVPIGTAVAGVRLRLELSGRPTPIGAVGELFIGGTGLAHCYVNRPSLTASRFVPDCSGAPGDRLYRTGDLCRFSGAGVLDYVGRIDDQVKVRGYRIELGEVEAALRAADAAVLDAAAVVRSVGGSTQLVGFVVLAASSGVADDAVARIRVAVRASLPAFMVPSALHRIDRLPLTPVGKVDRNRLLAMSDGRGSDVGGAVSPSTELEVALTRIWSAVLRAPTPSVDVSFFDMGGDSLLATQVVARIRDELCGGVDLAAIFRAPSVRGMAAHIASLREMPARALRAADAQLPFVFLVPGADWQPHTLDALRDSLLASSNVFVAERPGDDCSDLAATAAHLAQWIGGVRSAMPSLAPTVIVGYSSGGLVAFEVARLLEGTAHAPTKCILLESFVRCGIVPSAENAEAIWAGMLGRWLLPGRAPLARAAIGDLSAGARRDWFASVTDAAVAPTLDALLELHRRYVEVQSWHRTLERRAAEALVARASLVQLFTDSCPLWSLQVQADNSGGKGWLSLSGCSTRMVHVPGDHVTMLRAPHVATVGATIATLICE